MTKTTIKAPSPPDGAMQQERLDSIGLLAAGVAHELNNPLGFLNSNFTTMKEYLEVMLSYIALLENAASRNSEGAPGDGNDLPDELAAFKREEDIGFILEDIGDLISESREGIDRMAAIVQRLRTFSRVDHSIKVEEYDLNKAVENTLAMAGSEISSIAEVTTDFAQIPTIRCRSDEINMVLLNIFQNAVQAARAMHKSRKGRIEIKTFQEGDFVCCSISDNGPGIAAADEDRVFDPFFSTKAVGHGEGLGLSLSYDIVVRKHGGDLSFISEEEQGTVFTLKLPVHPALREEV